MKLTMAVLRGRGPHSSILTQRGEGGVAAFRLKAKVTDHGHGSAVALVRRVDRGVRLDNLWTQHVCGKHTHASIV